MSGKDDRLDTLLAQGIPEASSVVGNTTAIGLVSTSNQCNASHFTRQKVKGKTKKAKERIFLFTFAFLVLKVPVQQLLLPLVGYLGIPTGKDR
jgi:hypothetical protein